MTDLLKPTGGGRGWLETHSHDRKLGTLDSTLSQLKMGNFSINQKIGLFDKLIILIDGNPPSIFTSGAIRTIEFIKRDIGRSPNHSGADDLKADDMLAQLCYHIFKGETNEMGNIIVEQLSDVVVSGQCPPGRTNRLFQLLIAIQQIPVDSAFASKAKAERKERKRLLKNVTY